MPLEKVHRFVFIVAAVALFLATVIPSMGVSAKMAGSGYMMTMVATDGMKCPDCETSRDNAAGCMQATCIGFAVIANGEYFADSATHSAYAIATVAWPDDRKSAPSTPPI